MAEDDGKIGTLKESLATATPSAPAEPKPEMTLFIPRSPVSPLPGNRPIADNSTEDIDDMLGYLD